MSLPKGHCELAHILPDVEKIATNAASQKFDVGKITAARAAGAVQFAGSNFAGITKDERR